ncbi:hypothetical protein TWF718_006819 [Orbilia javanica]|uniref:Uncharacterized protein n=1 Tax=Orbilia javanica TaxID=47235 RepID=A0AAN8MZ12_9PEZI
MEPSHSFQNPSSSSSTSGLPSNDQSSSPLSPPAKKQRREYNSQKRVEAYTASNKPAYQAVKEAAIESLLVVLNYMEDTDEVWLRDVPKPQDRPDEGERPYYWAVSGPMTPAEERAWTATIGKGLSGPSQTGSRWGTENLHVLEGMLKSGLVRPFFADVPSTPGACNIVTQGSSVLGLGWGLMGDHEDPSTYDEGKYAAKGITLLRELPDAVDRVAHGILGEPVEEDPEGEDETESDESEE